jgi:subtilisin family serine protease
VRRLVALVLFVLTALTLAPARAASDPGRPEQWGLDRIHAAAERGQGEGVTVAVIDSGVDATHADLRGNVLPGTDIVDHDDDPADENGHGTHVAGIIAAVAGNGIGIAGVAPKAKVLPVRVLGADGTGSLDDVVAGMRWAVAHGAKVLNLSIGEDTQTLLGPSLGSAVRDAWDHGVITVIAAGNDYLLGSGFRDEPAIVVAGTTRDDGKPSYAGGGVGSAKWALAAPGGEDPARGDAGAILSTFWVAGKHDQYAYDCGPSMAAPHVAGAAAVLLGLGDTPQQTVDRLLATAKDIGAPGRDSMFGAGLLDLGRATAADGVDPANTEVPTTAPTGPPATTATTTKVTGAGTPTTAPAPAPTVTVQPSPSTTTKVDGALAGRSSSDGGGDAGSKAVPAVLAFLLVGADLVVLGRGRRAQRRRAAP